MISKPDIGTVLEHYGINVIDKHGWIPCKCVIHDDSHASAAYNLDNQAYNCLVCNLLGDVYDLVAKKEGMNFVSAKREAERIANGNSKKILRVNNTTGSLLPTGSRHNPKGSKFIPAWKRRGA